jgi:hypothetical protein
MTIGIVVVAAFAASAQQCRRARRLRSHVGEPDRPPAQAIDRCAPPPSGIRSPRCRARHSLFRSGLAAAKLESHGRIPRGYLGLGLRLVAIEGGRSRAMVMKADARGPGARAGAGAKVFRSSLTDQSSPSLCPVDRRGRGRARADRDPSRMARPLLLRGA